MPSRAKDGRAEPRTSILPLKVRNLGFRAGGRTILKDISFTLGPAGRTVLLGPNGAGKSLLLRICHGLITPDQGDVHWCGPYRGAVGARQALVFQRPVMLRRGAAANIDYALRLRRVPRADRRGLVAEALARTGLSGYDAIPARHLSGGEQQRLALARAWVLRPDVLFLDEPTASLDPAATASVEEIIRAMERDGTKIFMTTHDLAQARRLGDEIMFMHQGRIAERAPAGDFFNAPKSAEADAFLRGALTW